MHKQYLGLRAGPEPCHRLDVFIQADTRPEARSRGKSPRLRRLDPRFDLRRHSPDGFNCGYGGSGPAQLALALLADALEDDLAALCLYQEFKRTVVARLRVETAWTLSQVTILTWAEPHLAACAAELDERREQDRLEREWEQEADPAACDCLRRPELPCGNPYCIHFEPEPV